MRLDPADELSELLTPGQAARVADVSRRTLDRWIAAGRLTVYEVRGLTGRYVREDELLDGGGQAWGALDWLTPTSARCLTPSC